MKQNDAVTFTALLEAISANVHSSMQSCRALEPIHDTKPIHNKVHPKTGHEGPEGEYSFFNPRYALSTLSLTPTLDGVGGQGYAPAALPPRKGTPRPLYRRLGVSQGRSGRVRNI